jgi:hypothetical protein
MAFLLYVLEMPGSKFDLKASSLVRFVVSVPQCLQTYVMMEPQIRLLPQLLASSSEIHYSLIIL